MNLRDNTFLAKFKEYGEQITSSQPYALLESAVVVGLLAGIDGGFSGDWSKYEYASNI